MLTPQLIAQMNAVTGKSIPTTPGAPPSRAAEIRVIGQKAAAAKTPVSVQPAVPAAPNLGQLDAEQVKQGTAKIASSVTEGANKFNSEPTTPMGTVKRTGDLLETGLGAAAGGAQAVFAPFTAVIQKALSHSGGTPSITAPTASSPVEQHISAWATAHPEAAKNLVDAFTVATAAMGDAGGAANPINTDLGQAGKDFAGTVKDAAGNIKESMTSPTPEAAPVNEAAATESARSSAWKDIQPKATDKNIKAYRAKGATNPKGVLEGVTLNPSGADTRVIDHLAPLYKDGTIKPGMSTEEKLSAIETESRNASQTADDLVAAHNKIVETSEVQSALDSAKENSKVIFGSDKSLESAYSAPQQAYMDRLASGKAGATGTDTVSLRNALKSWDAEMKSKFPSLWKSAATGEITPTDSARLNGIMDTHTAIRDLIASKLGKDVPYTDALDKSSSLIKAGSMLNANANNLSKADSLIKLIKDHKLFSGIAAWEALKHTVAPALPGI